MNMGFVENVSVISPSFHPVAIFVDTNENACVNLGAASQMRGVAFELKP